MKLDRIICPESYQTASINEYTNEHRLMLAVIWRAVADWETLTQIYNYKHHLSLYNFFFSEDPAINYILEYFENSEYIYQNVISYVIKLSKFCDDINLLEKPDLNKIKQLCCFCKETYPLVSFTYKYGKCFTITRFSNICANCRDKGIGTRQFDTVKKRQEMFLDTISNYSSVTAALNSLNIDHMTFRNWKRQPHFIHLAKAKKVYSNILTKGKNESQ